MGDGVRHIKRYCEEQLLENARRYRLVILIAGKRTGTTTLIKRVFGREVFTLNYHKLKLHKVKWVVTGNFEEICGYLSQYSRGKRVCVWEEFDQAPKFFFSLLKSAHLGALPVAIICVLKYAPKSLEQYLRGLNEVAVVDIRPLSQGEKLGNTYKEDYVYFLENNLFNLTKEEFDSSFAKPNLWPKLDYSALFSSSYPQLTFSDSLKRIKRWNFSTLYQAISSEQAGKRLCKRISRKDTLNICFMLAESVGKEFKKGTCARYVNVPVRLVELVIKQLVEHNLLIKVEPFRKEFPLAPDVIPSDTVALETAVGRLQTLKTLDLDFYEERKIWGLEAVNDDAGSGLVNAVNNFGNFRKRDRISKKPMYYFTDLSYTYSLLNIDPIYPGRSVEIFYRNRLLKQFLYLELWKQSSWSAFKFQMWHYRHHDFPSSFLLIETFAPVRRIYALKVIDPRAYTCNWHLGYERLRKYLQVPDLIGVSLHIQNYARRHENDYLLPLSALWKV